MSYKGFLPHCAICTQPVNLTESKADEYGQAVHENCYASMLVSQKVDARSRYDDPSHIQTGQQIPFLVRYSDDPSPFIPMPHQADGGFWF
jgi:hypothetical protein